MGIKDLMADKEIDMWRLERLQNFQTQVASLKSSDFLIKIMSTEIPISKGGSASIKKALLPLCSS